MNFTVNAIDENPVPGSDVAAAGGKFRVLYTHGQCVLLFCLVFFSLRAKEGKKKKKKNERKRERPLSPQGKKNKKNNFRFAENSQFSLFNRLNQVIVTDPRVTNWIPDVGEFGDSGEKRATGERSSGGGEEGLNKRKKKKKS